MSELLIAVVINSLGILAYLVYSIIAMHNRFDALEARLRELGEKLDGLYLKES